MNKVQQIWVRSIDKIMLSCDTATLLITKGEFTRLSCVERMQLRMHLAGCKFCRRFKEQSEFISNTIRQADRIPEKENLHLYLTEEQKRHIKRKMEE
ncbi:hypothetical protein MNBD_BACTEROID07-1583 [hydrothermal vent metagenome]|uniref:Zinc-finger domain-containing protein n=1 Tax=hydrothermal vent metagenome TaxID=652676 RepID=A0A3B0UI31_9ZZZZ